MFPVCQVVAAGSLALPPHACASVDLRPPARGPMPAMLLGASQHHGFPTAAERSVSPSSKRGARVLGSAAAGNLAPRSCSAVACNSSPRAPARTRARARGGGGTRLLVLRRAVHVSGDVLSRVRVVAGGSHRVEQHRIASGRQRRRTCLRAGVARCDVAGTRRDHERRNANSGQAAAGHACARCPACRQWPQGQRLSQAVACLLLRAGPCDRSRRT